MYTSTSAFYINKGSTMADNSWTDSPWIECYENHSYEDQNISIEKLAWFDVKIELKESDNEKKERIEAMQQQVALGILQSNGLPVGMNVPQATIAAFNAQRKITPTFKLPNNGNFNGARTISQNSPMSNRPLGMVQSLAQEDVFKKAKNKMDLLSEIVKDRRRK